MSTNRTFFAGFWSLFRARSGFQQASTSATGGVSGASLTSAQKASTPSTFHTSSSHDSLTASAATTTSSIVAALSNNPKTTDTSNTSKTSTSPSSSSNTPVTNVHVSYQRHRQNQRQTSPGKSTAGHPSEYSPRTFRNGPLGSSSTSNAVAAAAAAAAAASRRRGSDSSSDGFREIRGEKWLIGGTTTMGEERFYRLEMIRKPKSIDRLSFDSISF